MLAPTKEEAMIKLLKLGPEPLPNLVRVTGWGELVTKTTLDTLIVQRKITLFRRHRGGAIFFKVSEGVDGVVPDRKTHKSLLVECPPQHQVSDCPNRSNSLSR